MPYRRKRVRFGGRGDYFELSSDPIGFTRTETHPLFLAGLQAARGAFIVGRTFGGWGLRQLRRRYYGHGTYTTKEGRTGEGTFIGISNYISEPSSQPNADGHTQTRAQRLDRDNAFVKGALGEAYAAADPSFAYTNVPKTIDGVIDINGVRYPCDIKATHRPLDQPPTDQQVYKQLGKKQRRLLDYGPLAVIIHHIDKTGEIGDFSYLTILEGTGKYGDPSNPEHTFDRLNEISPLTGDQSLEHTSLQGTPYTPPKRRKFADI